MSKIYVFYRYSYEDVSGRIWDEPEVLGYTEDKGRIEEILEHLWEKYGVDDNSSEVVMIKCEEVDTL